MVGLLVLLGQAWAVDCSRWDEGVLLRGPTLAKVLLREATLEEVRACLEAGADANAIPGGGTRFTPSPLLHQALDYPYDVDPEIIVLLIEYGADVNARDWLGEPPLAQAARHFPPEIVALLIEAGVAVDNDTELDGSFLHGAARFTDHPAVISLLIEYGADVNARAWRGETPLHEAARLNNHPAVTAILIEYGADVNARDKGGSTPLHYAATSFLSDPTTITLLLDAGADPTILGSSEVLPQAFSWEGRLTPWDLVKDRAEAYERLREATLGAESE